jgi:hypothetical protein
MSFATTVAVIAILDLAVIVALAVVMSIPRGLRPAVVNRARPKAEEQRLDLAA